MAGDNSSGIPTALRLIRGDGEPVDLRVPTTYNGKACGPINGWCQGRFILLEMAFADLSDTQLWYYFDSKYYASNLAQSLSGTTPPNAMDAMPLSVVGEPIGTELRRWYRGFPVSTTHLAVSRCFLPRDLLSDPLMTNTSEAKYEGVLYADTPEIGLFGPLEANRTLNIIQYQGRLDTAFETYNVPSSGVSIGPDKTTIIRYSIDNTGIPTKMPNALPILFTGTASWPSNRTWTVELDVTLGDVAADAEAWLQRLIDKSNEKETQALTLGRRIVPATLNAPNFVLEAAAAGAATRISTADRRSLPTLNFSQKAGTVAP